MHIDTCIDMYIDMSMGMCTDGCIHIAYITTDLCPFTEQGMASLPLRQLDGFDRALE